MTGYIDSSVLLRILFREKGKLTTIRKYTCLVSSELLRVECFRVLYRYRLLQQVSDEALGELTVLANDFIDEVNIVPLSSVILRRASLPLPVVLGTLDTIHFVTAQLWQEHHEDITLLTHDSQLQTAAKSVGMKTLG